MSQKVIAVRQSQHLYSREPECQGNLDAGLLEGGPGLHVLKAQHSPNVCCLRRDLL